MEIRTSLGYFHGFESWAEIGTFMRIYGRMKAKEWRRDRRMEPHPRPTTAPARRHKPHPAAINRTPRLGYQKTCSCADWTAPAAGATGCGALMFLTGFVSGFLSFQTLCIFIFSFYFVFILFFRIFSSLYLRRLSSRFSLSLLSLF